MPAVRGKTPTTGGRIDGLCPSSALAAIDSIGVKLFPLPHFLPASRATFYLLWQMSVNRRLAGIAGVSYAARPLLQMREKGEQLAGDFVAFSRFLAFLSPLTFKFFLDK